MTATPQDDSLTVLAALPQAQLLYGFSRGITPDKLCSSANISPLDLADRDRSVPYAWYRALWGALREHGAGQAMGIEFGRFVSLDHLGYAGQLFRYSRHGLDALEKAARFGRLINSLTDRNPSRLEVFEDEVHLILPKTLTDIPQCLDATTFSVVSQLRDLLKSPVRLRKAHLYLPRRELLWQYEEFLGCPVSFGDADTLLAFSREELERPVPGYDPVRSETIERFVCDTLLTDGTTLAPQAVGRVIDELLARGELSEDATARALGSSVRSLQRRLRELDTSYQQLADDRRKAAALRLLSQRSLAVYEVAWTLGYQDASSFNRAFKRWTGLTPRDYRVGKRAAE